MDLWVRSGWRFEWCLNHLVRRDQYLGDFAAFVAFGVDMSGGVDGVDVESGVEVSDEFAVGVGEHDLDAAIAEFGKGVAEPNLVLFGEGVTGVGGEFAGLVEGVVGRVEVDKIVGRFGASQDIFKADGFDTGGFEEAGTRSEQLGVVDAGVFVAAYGDVEVAFGVFAVESVETGFVEV